MAEILSCNAMRGLLKSVALSGQPGCLFRQALHTALHYMDRAAERENATALIMDEWGAMAQEWDRYWTAAGVGDGSISVDDAIARWQEMEKRVQELEEWQRLAHNALDLADAPDDAGTVASRIEEWAKEVAGLKNRVRELEASDTIRVEIVKVGPGDGEMFIDAVWGRVAICSLLDIEAEAQMEEAIDADGVYKCTATHDRATDEWDLDVLSYEPLTDTAPTQEEPTDG